MSKIEQNLSRVLRKIQAALEKSGRNSDAVQLIAVTKTHAETEILELKKLRIKCIGESRIQELTDKFPALKDNFEIHFIGHLQTNKVKPAVEMARMIHSVDSLKLAAAIDAECAKRNKIMEILLQINTSEEPQKSGALPETLPGLWAEARMLKHLRITGLMTMAMISPDAEKIRSCFRLLRQLLEQTWKEGADPLEFRHLSMGMSDDYEIAVEEGATMIRIGSALFEQG
jgi:PLP dependent protein